MACHGRQAGEEVCSASSILATPPTCLYFPELPGRPWGSLVCDWPCLPWLSRLKAPALVAWARPGAVRTLSLALFLCGTQECTGVSAPQACVEQRGCWGPRVDSAGRPIPALLLRTEQKEGVPHLIPDHALSRPAGCLSDSASPPAHSLRVASGEAGTPPPFCRERAPRGPLHVRLQD